MTSCSLSLHSKGCLNTQSIRWLKTICKWPVILLLWYIWYLLLLEKSVVGQPCLQRSIRMSLTLLSVYRSIYAVNGESTPLAPHSSTLAWKIPGMEEPGGLQSMGSLGVGHDWVTSLSLFTFMHWRRKWQPTPVFLPGESQGRGILVGCRLWGHTESDMTDAT